jgi:SAM-dependent methyltransferase
MADTESPTNPPSQPPPSSDQIHIADAANQAQSIIEAASASDSGSDIGYDTDSNASTSTSISSSVRDYVFENGRRYHKFREGFYAYPNDSQESEREDMKHAMALAACGDRLHLAPLGPSPGHILDLGTGTGIWCVEMGDTYPSATVTGIDLSPIQPTWVPPNVRFLVDDAASEWLYPLDHFDLVHARHCISAFKDWPGVFRSAMKHLKPGGWMELQDFYFTTCCDDGTMPENYGLTKLLTLTKEGMKVMGVDLEGVLKKPDEMREAGFVDVQVKQIKMPIGKWPKNPLLKKVGLYLLAVILDGLEGISLGPLCRGLGWQKQEVDVLLAEVRTDLKNSSIHSYYSMHTVYGQKPTS